jgi:hypothetical protein
MSAGQGDAGALLSALALALATGAFAFALDASPSVVRGAGDAAGFGTGPSGVLDSSVCPPQADAVSNTTSLAICSHVRRVIFGRCIGLAA